MMRWLFIALVTTAVVAAAPGVAAAQPKPAPIPVAVANGAPGVSIEFFLNAGKLADATVDATGTANWLLDLGNMGKTKVTIYIDVCKDGKVVKVMFVTGSGQAPPEDEGCNRRLAAVSFQSDCGVTRITLDFTNFGAKVIGCGLSFTDPKVLGTVGGAGVLVAVLVGGGGGTTTTTAVSTAPPPTTTTTVTATPPATNTPPPSTPPPPTPTPLPSGAFTLTLVFHPANANTSQICGVVSINPAAAGTRYTITGSGPGVLPNQNVSGTFNASGNGGFILGIAQLGTYTLTMTITTSDGRTVTVTTTVNVTSASAPQCPIVPA